MSLVGSLEDLGLGEILQIMGLSGKSGVLRVRSPQGEGRILFEGGLVRGAHLAGRASDLHELLRETRTLPAEELDDLVARARGEGIPLEKLLVGAGLLDADALETLRRRQVETVLSGMFRWVAGEFTFEVGGGGPDGDLLLLAGLNAQFLALECARRNDEEDAVGGPSPEDLDQRVPETPEVAPDGSEREVTSRAAVPRAVIVIDGHRAVLEWAKRVLHAGHERIHVFQRPEHGIARIRQYLSRGELPVVIVAEDSPADPVSGAPDGRALVERLRVQAPRMPMILLCPAGFAPVGFTAATLAERPDATWLADPAAADRCAELAEHLCRAAEEATSQAEGGVGEPLPQAARRRLASAAARLRKAPAGGDVLRQVLDFAAEDFHRVALFRIQDEQAVGLAQAGLPAAGGPDDPGLRQVRLPLDAVPWFRAALEVRAGVRRGPQGEGDRRLAACIGEVVAPQAYLAPIESAGRIVALLYADNLPTGEPLADTRALEALLAEVGRALDAVRPGRPPASERSGMTSAP